MRFYLAVFVGKVLDFIAKILIGKPSHKAGKIAMIICPDILEKIGKPEKIVGITGTNGKTTVTNLIVDSMQNLGYKVLNNKEGSNIEDGLVTALVAGANLKGESKYKYAVLELDERYSPILLKSIKLDYLVITNMLRDSIRRNAHVEFITKILTDSINENTTIIVNGDDIVASSIGNVKKKIYYSFSKQENDTKEPFNRIRDIMVCPICYEYLKYDYVKTNHIGKIYCPNGHIQNSPSNYNINTIDKENGLMNANINGKHYNFPLISESMFNQYNEIATIAFLSEIGHSPEEIADALKGIKIVKTRYSEYQLENNTKLILNLTKGQNSFACTNVFKYVKDYPGTKSIILILDDASDNKIATETIMWHYDADWNLFNDPSVKQVIIGGPRSVDVLLKALLDGIPEEKLHYELNELDVPNKLDYSSDTVFLLYDIYAQKLAWKVRDKILKEKGIEGKK